MEAKRLQDALAWYLERKYTRTLTFRILCVVAHGQKRPNIEAKSLQDALAW
jgi:hypothetical protein